VGGGVLQPPLGNGNSNGVGGVRLKTLRGRGMDILWNRIIEVSTEYRFVLKE